MTYLIRRFASAYIDALVVMFLILIYKILTAVFKGQALYNIDSPSADYWLVLQLIFLFIYYLTSEFFFNRTIGKMIFKFRITGLEKSLKAKLLKQVLLRTISRFIPFEPFSILLDERRIMWHDKISKTMVVDTRNNEKSV